MRFTVLLAVCAKNDDEDGIDGPLSFSEKFQILERDDVFFVMKNVEKKKASHRTENLLA